MKTHPVETRKRGKPRRYKRCRCRRNVSPIVDTFHAPLTRWTFTALALVSGLAHLPGPFALTLLAAIVAWRHR